MTLFTEADIISTYTRTDALDDGVLIEASPALCKDAGIVYPVALTMQCWDQCVEWRDKDTKRRGVPQDEVGRLWDILWMFRQQAARMRSNRAGAVLMFTVHIVSRQANTQRPISTELKAVCGPGDQGEPVITIMLPTED